MNNSERYKIYLWCERAARKVRERFGETLLGRVVIAGAGPEDVYKTIRVWVLLIPHCDGRDLCNQYVCEWREVSTAITPDSYATMIADWLFHGASKALESCDGPGHAGGR